MGEVRGPDDLLLVGLEDGRVLCDRNIETFWQVFKHRLAAAEG